MNFFTNHLPVIMVIAGAGYMAASILLSLKTSKGIPAKHQSRWKLLIGLMLFFLAGYLVFIFIQIYQLNLPIEVIVGLVFLFGAFFVYFAMGLTKNIIEQLKDIQDELEIRVEKRTEDLSLALQDLKKEVHEHKETAMDLERVNVELYQILNSSSNGILVIDKNFNIKRLNHTFAEMAGIPEKELIGAPYQKAVHSEKCPTGDCLVGEIFAGGKQAETEMEIIGRDGKKISCLVNAYPYLNHNSELVGAVEEFRDITELKKIEARLQELSITDELTGLLNRRGFISVGGSQLELAGRMGKTLLLFYIDLDDMKWINDNLGHAVGDQALIEAADTLRETFRKSDIIGITRLGGDEFAVLMFSKADEMYQHPVLNRLNSRIEDLNSEQDRSYNLSMSIGIVEYDPEDPCSIEELIEQGDQAMYLCKRQGKQ